MVRIDRNHDAASKEDFDLIVVGAGIYGVCVALEAARRGVKVLLVEKQDFGGATSLNSLRIVHGGLRYLQNLDFGRFRRSVVEQAWWLENFPDQVQPLSCLMPLYGRGLKRNSVLWAALQTNNLLARSVRTRHLGRRVADLLRGGQILDVTQTRDRFPLVRSSGLTGSALWYDARMKSPQRLLMESLLWAVHCGATALNYTECEGLIEEDGRYVGIRAKCMQTQQRYSFSGSHIVNCAGPWVHTVARDQSSQLPSGSSLALAMNVLLDRPPGCEDAIAVTPDNSDSGTYFMVPVRKQIMVGTVHLPNCSPPEESQTLDARVQALLDELNRALPGYDIQKDEVVSIFAGRLPAAETGSRLPSRTPRIVHHGQSSPNGLTSIVGVKYTTARHIAERTLREIWHARGQQLPTYAGPERPPQHARPLLSDLVADPSQESAQHLLTWIREESVVHIDDLLIRRCDCCTGQTDSQTDRFRQVLRGLVDHHESEIARDNLRHVPSPTGRDDI